MAEYINREDAIKTYCDGCPLYEKCISDGIGCSKMQMFKKFPAADVRENVRGKWISDMMGYKCSVCGLWVDDEAFYYLMEPSFDYGSNFCPNCGAKMRGADNG